MELTPRRFADTIVLSTSGRVDHATAEAFETALLGQLGTCATGQDRVVLDMAGIDYISSAGLRALLLAARQVKAQGGVLVAAALQPLVREVFEIAHFTLVFTTFPSVRDAIAEGSPAGLAAFEAAGNR